MADRSELTDVPKSTEADNIRVTPPERLPRSVLVVTDHLYNEIASNPDTVSIVADVDAMIVPLTMKPSVNTQLVSSVRSSLIRADQLSPNALLVKNPFTERSFEFADVAIEAFASAKYNALANVARLLGAKTVKFTDVTVELTESDWLAGVKMKLPVGGGDAEARREVKRRVEHSLEGDHVFMGGEPDVEAAQDLLRRRHLVADSQLAELVEMRTGKNLILEYRMTMNGTKEAASSFRAALDIANATPVKALNIGAEFTKKVTSMQSVDIKIEITF
jgi:hypothetical protein